MDDILIFERNKGWHIEHRIDISERTRHGWNCHFIPPDISAEQAKGLIRFWNPIGCIVNNDALPASVFRNVPTVFSHRDPSDLPRGAAVVSYDETALGEAAARELISLSCASYAYVPYGSSPYWSRMRGRAFADAVRLNAAAVSSFDWGKANPTGAKARRALARWLASLPRPVGLFAANDEIAEIVLETCVREGLAVPGEVRVLGADDVIARCERTMPTLSSLRPDESEYQSAALRLIARLIDGPRQRQRGERLLVSNVSIVRRGSTRILNRHDPAVARALDFIRRHATLPATDVNAVIAAAFACSRRVAETRFRKATGSTILTEIRTMRLKKARELLADGRHSVESIAGECGYSSANSLRALLRDDSFTIHCG